MSGMKNFGIWLGFVLTVIFISQNSLACSPYGTPLATHTIVGNNLNITVTSTSSWSCTFNFQLELICAQANFTGTPNYTNTPTISKPNNQNMNYPVYTIDISTLCPGTTYKYRVRERHPNYNYWSNWSAVYEFTVPGPPFLVELTANPVAICPPQCTDLTASYQNNCGPVTLSWSNGAGNVFTQNVCPTEETTYTVTGSVQVPMCPIPITESATVTVGVDIPAEPGIASLTPNPICRGESTTVSVIDYYGNLQWEISTSPNGPFNDIPGATNEVETFGPFFDDVYFRVRSFTCTEEFSNVIHLQVLNDPVADFNFTNACHTYPTSFTDLSSDPYPFVEWDWNFGDGNSSGAQNPSHTYGTQGEYTVTLISTTLYGCKDTTSKQVTVYPTPVPSFNGIELSGCGPICPQLVSTSTVAAPSSIVAYQWSLSNGMSQVSTDPEFMPCIENNTSSTIFLGAQLTVVTETGCSATLNEPNYIEVYHNPVADFSFYPFDADILDPTITFTNNSLYHSSHNWLIEGYGVTQVNDPIIEFPNNQQGNYDVTLAVATEMGCADTAYAVVPIKDVILFYIPNTFTPDGDDYNETFQPIFTSGFDPMDFHLMIFNRWGEVIFESYDASRGWDGTYGASSARIVRDGTYIWRIEFKETMSDKRHTHHGHVNIIR
jgi:gliding motility-associated-like protein